MKHLLGLCIVVLLMFSAGLASAQDEHHPVTSSDAPVHFSSGHMFDDPIRMAAADARLHQFDLLKKQAKEALKNKETAKAISLMEKAADFDLDDEVRTILARLYARAGRPKDVMRILGPIIYPSAYYYSGISQEITTRMNYVLALLDTNQWEEAVALYERSIKPNLLWDVPGNDGTTLPTVPEVHFSTDAPDYAGLRAQAHLILGARSPHFSEVPECFQIMLEHLQQTLKIDRNSPDAHFLSGLVLKGLGRIAEARVEFRLTAKLAPEDAQPLIKAALDKLDQEEAMKKLFEAQQAKRQAEQKVQTHGTSAP